MEVKTFYEQLHGKKSNVQEWTEINHSTSVIGQNDQNQSNKQNSQESPNHEKLRMQSTLISRVKNKISPKNRRECDQEITAAKKQ